MKNLLLLVATCLATWLAVMFWESPTELFFRDKKSRVEPLPPADSYMLNTRTEKFDEDGTVAYILSSVTGFYYANDDRFELKTPQLIARKPARDEAPWLLTADEASSTMGGEDVLLTGSVHASQELKKGRIEFFTDNIRFSPRDNIATTDAGVKLIHPEGSTTGQGMKADFNLETYQLLANVRSSYHAR